MSTTTYQFLTQQPGVILKHTKEGTESSAFWFALGGKQNYTSQKVVQDIVKDPHLFTISFNKGWYFFFQIKDSFFFLACVAFDVTIYMTIFNLITALLNIAMLCT